MILSELTQVDTDRLLDVSVQKGCNGTCRKQPFVVSLKVFPPQWVKTYSGCSTRMKKKIKLCHDETSETSGVVNEANR